MRFRGLLLVCLALALALAACGGLPGNVVVLMPDDATGKVGKVIVQNAGGTTQLDQALAAVETRPGAKPGPVFAAKQADVSDSFASAVAGTPRAPVAYVIYFVTGQTEIRTYSRTDLATAINTAKTTPNVDVSVVGHADATGPEAENLALSLRRAEIVRNALVAAGVPADTIELAYHGSNNPRVQEAKGVPEPRSEERRVG